MARKKGHETLETMSAGVPATNGGSTATIVDVARAAESAASPSEEDGGGEDEEVSSGVAEEKPAPRAKPVRARKATPPPPPPPQEEEEETSDELEGEDPDPLEVAAQAQEQDPLVMGAVKNTSYLRVNRVEANGPSKGFQNASDYTGPCGQVVRRMGYEDEVRRRWGGGKYEIIGLLKGQPKSIPLEIGGPSKAVDPIDEDDIYYDDDAGVGQGYGSPVAARPGYGAYPAGSPYGQAPGYGSPAGGYPGAPGYPPYGGVPGYPPGYPPYNPMAAAYSQRRLGLPGEETEEARLLREELEATKAQLAEAKESARIAELKREMDRKDAEHKRELDAIKALVQSKPHDSEAAAKTLERIEQDRLDRQQKWDQELADRREAREAAERREKEERERREREEKERRDREERLDRERREREDREREERRLEAQRAEKQFDRMLTLMNSNAQKPADMIQMLASLKDLSSNGSMPEQMQAFMGMLMSAKEIFGDGGGGDGEEDGLDKAERFLKAMAEFSGPAMGKLTEYWEKRATAKERALAPAAQNPQIPAPPPVYHPLYGQQQPQVTQQAPAGAIPQQQAPPSQPQATPQAHAQQVEQESARTGVTPQQWGAILEHVVDSAIQQSQPREAAEHLLTVMKTVRALKALEVLAGARVPDLRGRVKILILSKRVTDEHFVQKMNQFVALSEHEGGKKWLEALLAELRDLFELIKKHAAQKVEQARQAQAAQGAAPAPAATAPTAPQQPPPVQQAAEAPDGGELEEDEGDEEFEEGDDGEAEEGSGEQF